MRDMDFERGPLRGRGRQHLEGQALTDALCWMQDERAPGTLIVTPDGDDVLAQVGGWRPSPAPWEVRP